MSCRYTYKGKTYEVSEFDDLLRAMAPAEAAAYMPGVTAVPAAPFVTKTDAWLGLALKRVVKMAVDEGYDRVAFINGEQSAERYDLSKQVQAILYQKNKDGTFTLGIRAVGDSPNAAFQRLPELDNVPPERLGDVIGKEIAERIVKGEGRENFTAPNTRVLSGLDLKVGGEGMRAFYDQIVPQEAAKLVKKLGGEGLVKVTVGTPLGITKVGRGWRVVDRDGNDQFHDHVFRDQQAALRKAKELGELEQPGFSITDKMRDQAADGLPLFSKYRTDPDLESWAEKALSGGYTATPWKKVAPALPHPAWLMAGLDSRLPVTIDVRLVSHLKRSGHEEVTPGMIGRLADLMANPRVMVRNEGLDEAGNKITRYQALLDARDHLGRPLLVAVRKSKEGVRGEAVDVYDVRSMFGRQESMTYVIDQLRHGGVVWMSDKAATAVRDFTGGGTVPRAAPKNGSQPSLAVTGVIVPGDASAAAFPDKGWKALGNRITVPNNARNRSAGVQFSPVRQTETEEFKRWFKDSKVVDESGKPMLMFHGTESPGFTVFNRLKSAEWRRQSMDTVGSWFSNNPDDSNGAGLYGRTIYPVYLSIQKPKVYRTFQDFLRHMHRAAGRKLEEQNPPGIGSTEELRAELKAEGYDGIEFMQTANESLMGDIKEMQAAVDRAKNDEFSVPRRDRAPYTMKRERLEQTLKSMKNELDEYASSTEFDGQRVFIAFEPEQIKSAVGNNGAFDPANPDITKSSARWSEDRIQNLMSRYAYTMDDTRTKAYAGRVSPEDFLAATTPADSVGSLESEKTPLDPQELVNQDQPIMLIGDIKDGKRFLTRGHEGRHRMMALRDAGVRSVPIVFDLGSGVSDREILDSHFATKQSWGDGLTAQKGFLTGTLVPISYKHLPELRKRFGRDAEMERLLQQAKMEPEVMFSRARWFDGATKVADVYERTDGQASEILDGDEYDLAWHEKVVPAAQLPVYDMVDQEKFDQFSSSTAKEMSSITKTTPPLLFIRKDGSVKLLDGGHRIARAQAVGGNITILFANEPDITRSTDRAFDAPEPSRFDDLVYKMQDKQVDLKRVVAAVKDARGAISDDLDAYLQEELFHGRAAKRTEDFVHLELEPLIADMAERGLTIGDLDEYLHARHAKEANAVIRARNPGLADAGSGMSDADADAYFDQLGYDKRDHLAAVAAKVDAMQAATRSMLVDYELVSRAQVDSWREMFQHYVPLMREDEGGHTGNGTGQGFSIKGKEVKSRTGSTRKVVDILANIAMQRERTIVRGEKNRVSRALFGLAAANPNEDFWTVDTHIPSERVFNAKTGLVETRPDNLFKQRPNVVVTKMADAEGRVSERAVIFNENSERAMRMAESLKNLDAAQLEGLLGASAKLTRYFSAVNTQYNPVFGVVNLVRDVQGAMVNLGTTELAGKQKEIARQVPSALGGIYRDLRAVRKGGVASSDWAHIWEDFQNVGGQTGYRDLFRTSADRAKAIEHALDPTAWMDSKLGRIFTVNGALKVPLAAAQRGAKWIFDWLSDYNEAMENGVRLATYKAGLDAGLSKERAASIAKNLTVNFNRKGQVAQQAGALYAFFNASMQGTARLGQVLFDMDPGKPKTLRLSSLGKKVVYGGMLLGSIQALALAAAGFGDDDPPEWQRERSLIIPIGDKKYVTIPLPLGLHVIPNIGRVTTAWALSGFKNPTKRAIGLFGTMADAFNPIGNAGLSMQTLSPTALDPLVALTENKDWSGRPIARESSNKAIPGYTLARDTSSTAGKIISEAINYLSGGTKYTAGVVSPTPDQVDFLLGQLTGGVGRELGKVEQTGLGAVHGEEVPLYKVPLVGRFVGNAKSQASEGSAFYANVERLNELETEIKGMRKDGKAEEANQVALRNPQAYLITQANHAEQQVQKLRRQKSELVKAGAPREQVSAIEARITERMAALNRAVEALEAR